MMQNGPSLRVLQRKRLNAPCAHMHALRHRVKDKTEVRKRRDGDGTEGNADDGPPICTVRPAKCTVRPTLCTARRYQ